MPENPTRGERFAADFRADRDLAVHVDELVTQAARLIDRADALDEVVIAEGVTSGSSQGVRAHPALVEARQTRAVLHRILIALDPASAGAI